MPLSSLYAMLCQIEATGKGLPKTFLGVIYSQTMGSLVPAMIGFIAPMPEQSSTSAVHFSKVLGGPC